MTKTDDDNRAISAILGYLNSLPDGSEVRWGTHHLLSFEDFATGWVDVVLPDADLPMSWVWTIVGPDDEDLDGLPALHWCFGADHDLAVHCTYDPDTFWWVNEWPTPIDQPAPEWVLVGNQALADRLGTQVGTRPAWSGQRIQQALADWIATATGRTDLTLRFDPTYLSPYVSDAIAARDAALNGTADTYDLGDGIHATGQVMDFLGNEPDLAADLLESFKAFVAPILDQANHPKSD